MSHRVRNLTALAVVVGVVCVGYWLERDVPSERYRVRHPQGYSICRPSDWSADMDQLRDGEKLGHAERVDGISLEPDQFTGIPPKMFVNRFASAPDPAALEAEGWVSGTFQGQPAMMREKMVTRGLTRGAVFQRDGQWFEVIAGVSVAGAINIDKWWRFLETFRYPDGEPAKVEAVGAEAARATTGPASTRPFLFPGSQ